MSKILPVDIENTLKLAHDLSKAHQKINDRLREILTYLYTKKGKKLSWFELDDLPVSGARAPHLFFESDGELSHCCFIDRDGATWDIGNCLLPLRWLYEDFEEEFNNGHEAYEEQERQKKIARLEAKKKKLEGKSELRKSAKAKLTKEEIEALGL
jgi:hypothetical protein